MGNVEPSVGSMGSDALNPACVMTNSKNQTLSSFNITQVRLRANMERLGKHKRAAAAQHGIAQHGSPHLLRLIII